jgi:peptidoglycan/xylan/chitin deacetylase (PgdA/CDA1 family)
MKKLTIVTYHFVRNRNCNKIFRNLKYLHVNKFKKQIFFFKKNYNFIDPNFLDLYQSGKKKIPNKPILLTFDDGYKDHFKYVFPILKKNGIKAIFFPITSTINTSKIIQANIIQLLLSVISIDKIYKELNQLIDYWSLRLKIKINLSQLIIKLNKNKNKNRNFDKGKVIIFKRLLQTYLPLKLRNKILDILYSKYIKLNKKKLNKILYMSLTDLKILKKNNMVIGSHTHNHERFSFLDRDKKKYEIKKSIIFLKLNKLLDSRKYYFCYPYGDFDYTSKKYLIKEKFIFAFTTKKNFSYLKKSQFNLSRFDANDFS